MTKTDGIAEIAQLRAIEKYLRESAHVVLMRIIQLEMDMGLDPWDFGQEGGK